VRVAGTRSVVADGDRLDPLDRDLGLPAVWSHPGGDVLGHPADDLLRGAVPRRVVRGGDLRVQ
jgi:hypothetical protein